MAKRRRKEEKSHAVGLRQHYVEKSTSKAFLGFKEMFEDLEAKVPADDRALIFWKAISQGYPKE